MTPMFQVGEAKLEYATAGHGPDLVLLHVRVKTEPWGLHMVLGFLEGAMLRSSLDAD